MKQKFLLFFSLCLITATSAWAQTATAPSAGSGTESDPYQIANLEHLYWITQADTAWDAYYEQTADIDASQTSTWDSGSGFYPIGNGSTKFIGSYNGGGYTISNLYINRSSEIMVGLFGNTSGATISKIGLLDCEIEGDDYVGALVGHTISSKVISCYATGGKVDGDKYVGGLIGEASYISVLSCSYTSVPVNGTSGVGGLVGSVRQGGTIADCYAIGTVNASSGSDEGAILGRAGSGNPTVTNCYWNTETCGITTASAGCTGLTTSQMKQQSLFIGWNFTGETIGDTKDMWIIDPNVNNGFPVLTWQLKDTASRPNILLIVADDLGWTDIGCYGSEISTPNIDAIAERGMMFTNFHTSVSCSPTRSMLLSGTDNHIAGMGNMSEMRTPEQMDTIGYEGYLNDSVVCLAKVLKDGGYHTYMSGKWHLGHDTCTHYPFGRGFERSFSMLFGGASYWSDMHGLAEGQDTAKYVVDDMELDSLPKDFYATRNYTDTLMNMIRKNKADDKPFFAYLAFTAAHDPLHVPEPWLSMYKDKYDDGYEVLKNKRAHSAISKGLIKADTTLIPSNNATAHWNSLTPYEKEVESKGMEVYAGIISNMDYHIGRMINYLKDIGEYNNTVIIFMSDNGSNPWYSEDYERGQKSRYLKQFDNSVENIGNPMSHYAYGPGWGSACTGPLNRYKLTVGEGGIRTPMIMAGPGINQSDTATAFTYVTDIMPTILEQTNIEYLPAYKNKAPIRGKSLSKILSGNTKHVYSDTDTIAGEMAGCKWVTIGDYKATYEYGEFDKDDQEIWKLFNINSDPGEVTDLAAGSIQLLNSLKEAWEVYADEVGVVKYEQ
jgi:arylsulfatase